MSVQDSDNKDKQQEIAQRYLKIMKNQDVSGAEEFITEFVEQVQVPNVKVPENVFREVFLPYILGEKSIDPEDNPIAHWRGLVGSPTNPADVVDMKGNLLFVVPPLYDSGRINTKKKGPSRMTRIFNDLMEDSHVRPVKAAEDFSERLAEETVDLQERTSTTSQYSWEPVFAFYGLLEETDNTLPAKEKEDTKIDPDEFEFDF